MNKVRTVLFYILLFGLAITISCGNAGVDPVEDRTDEDAIYNIIRFDNPQAFSIDMLDLPVPDTATGNGIEPYLPVDFWRTVSWDSLFIDIGDQDTVIEDSSRIVPVREVLVEQHYRGKLEIIALDTTDGGSRRVRLSKDYAGKGVIPATFKKYGFDYNSRRGWRLTSIGNTSYGNLDGQIQIRMLSDPGNVITVGRFQYPLDEFPSFADGESLSVSVILSNPDSRVSLKCPTQSGFGWMELNRAESGVFEGGFRFHDIFGVKHLLVDVVQDRILAQDTTAYFPSSVGVLYNIR